MHILVIDDEPAMLRVLQSILQQSHEVEVAATASVALRLVAERRFDVILCDLHMPGMDGCAFEERLSPLDAGNVIFITGGAYQEGDDEFLAAHRFLTKPFSAAKLAEAMEAMHDAAA